MAPGDRLARRGLVAARRVTLLWYWGLGGTGTRSQEGLEGVLSARSVSMPTITQVSPCSAAVRNNRGGTVPPSVVASLRPPNPFRRVRVPLEHRPECHLGPRLHTAVGRRRPYWPKGRLYSYQLVHITRSEANIDLMLYNHGSQGVAISRRQQVVWAAGLKAGRDKWPEYW